MAAAMTASRTPHTSTKLLPDVFHDALLLRDALLCEGLAHLLGAAERHCNLGHDLAQLQPRLRQLVGHVVRLAAVEVEHRGELLREQHGNLSVGANLQKGKRAKGGKEEGGQERESLNRGATVREIK